MNTERKQERKRDMSSLAVDHLIAEDRVKVWSAFHILNQPGSCLNPVFAPWSAAQLVVSCAVVELQALGKIEH